jgi:hypothetical protein
MQPLLVQFRKHELLVVGFYRALEGASLVVDGFVSVQRHSLSSLGGLQQLCEVLLVHRAVDRFLVGDVAVAVQVCQRAIIVIMPCPDCVSIIE